jgi:pantoate--beta-alanine ligase
MIKVVEEPNQLRAICDAWRAQGERVGLVPTMGALHPGHMSLVHAARRAGASKVALSIFVNPLQFGPSEDFHRYPRTFDQDVAQSEEAGVEVIFAPSASSFYPSGYQTYVDVEQVTKRFEGAFRPGHFRGVTTVVAKLFQATGPCVAVFGRKDFQQWRVIETMTRDLNMPIEVVGCPTIREPDGLAMSSRNRYLGADERVRALAIYLGLRAAEEAFSAGERDPSRLEGLVREPVAAAFDSIDYVAVGDAQTLEPCANPLTNKPVVLVAARIGSTRLIDNAVLGEDTLCIT